MSFLDKTRKLPEKKRKMIAIGIVIILGIIMFSIWTMFSLKRAGQFKTDQLWQDLKIDKLKEDIEQDLPKMEGLDQLKDIDLPENPQDFN